MTRFRNAAVRQYFVLRHYAVGNIIMCHPGKICEILYFFRRVLAHFEILKLIFVNDFVVKILTRSQAVARIADRTASYFITD